MDERLAFLPRAAACESRLRRSPTCAHPGRQWETSSRSSPSAAPPSAVDHTDLEKQDAVGKGSSPTTSSSTCCSTGHGRVRDDPASDRVARHRRPPRALGRLRRPHARAESDRGDAALLQSTQALGRRPRGRRLHGITIPASSWVTLMYGSANRDARSSATDTFDLGRELRHVAFSVGILLPRRSVSRTRDAAPARGLTSTAIAPSNVPAPRSRTQEPMPGRVGKIISGRGAGEFIR